MMASVLWPGETLGLAGLIGADARVPGMVLLRAPLGRRGSYLPTVLNVARGEFYFSCKLTGVEVFDLENECPDRVRREGENLPDCQVFDPIAEILLPIRLRIF